MPPTPQAIILFVLFLSRRAEAEAEAARQVLKELEASVQQRDTSKAPSKGRLAKGRGAKGRRRAAGTSSDGSSDAEADERPSGAELGEQLSADLEVLKRTLEAREEDLRDAAQSRATAEVCLKMSVPSPRGLVVSPLPALSSVVSLLKRSRPSPGRLRPTAPLDSQAARLQVQEQLAGVVDKLKEMEDAAESAETLREASEKVLQELLTVQVSLGGIAPHPSGSASARVCGPGLVLMPPSSSNQGFKH